MGSRLFPRLTAKLVALVLTVLVTLVSLTPGAAVATRVPGGAGWVTFKGGGVTFLHPASWTVKHETSGALYVFIDPAGAAFRRNINLMLQAGTTPITAAGYLATNLGQISQDHGTISHKGPLSFDGTPGYRVIWAAKFSGTAFQFLSQWTVRHGKVWLVTYTSDYRRFSPVLAAVERLLASIKLPA